MKDELPTNVADLRRPNKLSEEIEEEKISDLITNPYSQLWPDPESIFDLAAFLTRLMRT